jgi:hypothetical protein
MIPRYFIALFPISIRDAPRALRTQFHAPASKHPLPAVRGLGKTGNAAEAKRLIVLPAASRGEREGNVVSLYENINDTEIPLPVYFRSLRQ